MSRSHSRLSLILPGILLAATGVGAGDLFTSALAGSEVGLAVIWAVVVGALLKWVLTEGITRWQLATGTTLLEGWHAKLGAWTQWVFLFYLVFFAVAVGSALASACGVAGAAIFPVGDLETSKIFWGAVHSLAGLLIVWRGSFELFERWMAALVVLMFVTVLGTALAVGPDWAAVAAALIPRASVAGSSWFLAILGGVGGTVTLLTYGYWIREEGRVGPEQLRACRIDLAVGNGMTGLFGIAVVIIGSRLELQGSGAALATQMADQLAAVAGPAGRALFLVGFWGAVFSSLLGVWQGLPYLFADAMRLQTQAPESSLRETPHYRWFLVGLALVPILFLTYPVRHVLLFYAVFASMFLPVLAVTLLILNNRSQWVGERFRTPLAINVLLIAAVALFGYLGLR